MDKFAQRRGLLNKLHEWGNVSGRSAEKFFNPEFLKVMTALRLRDDNIRSIVAGEAIGDGNPGRDKTSVKQLLKSAKSNLNRREYMQGVSDLGRFHSKLLEVANEIGALDSNVNEVHEGFLFKHLSDKGKDNETPEEFEKRTKHLEHLKDLKQRFSSAQKNVMIKEANIADLLVNMGTQRGRALAAWEKRYKGQTAALKAESGKQVEIAEKILELTLSQLKVMATHRAGRNVDEYMRAAKKISDKYELYDMEFKKYYTTHIKGFLEKMFPKEVLAPETTSATPAIPGSPKVPDLSLPGSPKSDSPKAPDMASPSVLGPVGTPPTMPSRSEPTVYRSPLAPPVAPTALHDTLPPSAAPATIPAPDTIPSPAPDMTVAPPESGVVPTSRMTPDEMRNMEQQHGVVANHKNFYSTLQSMSNENPIILKSFISTYAKKIASSDPTTSIQLLNVVKSIKG